MQTYNFPTFYRGDTYKGTTFILKDKDGVVVDITNYTIICEFRKNKKDGGLQKRLITDDGITYTDPTNGKFIFDPFDVDWDAGNYAHDIQFDDGTGNIDTYLEGSATVEQDVTQD